MIETPASQNSFSTFGGEQTWAGAVLPSALSGNRPQDWGWWMRDGQTLSDTTTPLVEFLPR